MGWDGDFLRGASVFLSTGAAFLSPSLIYPQYSLGGRVVGHWLMHVRPDLQVDPECGLLLRGFKHIHRSRVGLEEALPK